MATAPAAPPQTPAAQDQAAIDAETKRKANIMRWLNTPTQRRGPINNDFFSNALSSAGRRNMDSQSADRKSKGGWF